MSNNNKQQNTPNSVKESSSKSTGRDDDNLMALPMQSPEEQFGFDPVQLQGEMGISGILTHLPKSLIEAFRSRGYELQYVNYANMAEWNRWMARSNGAVRPVTTKELESVVGRGASYGLAVAKAEMGGKEFSGVVRAGEMVLMMIPTSIVTIRRREIEAKTLASRQSIYGSTKSRQFNRHVKNDIMADDGTKVVQTVVRGSGSVDPFSNANAYVAGDDSFGD